MKKLVFFVVILISLFIINGLIRSTISLTQKNTVVEKAEKELQAEKAENTKLKKQLAQVSDPTFIEKEARNKLFLVKPGEEVVIIPSPTIVSNPDQKEAAATVKKANWQQWVDLFVGK